MIQLTDACQFKYCVFKKEDKYECIDFDYTYMNKSGVKSIQAYKTS